MIEQDMMHFHLDKVKDIVGFTPINVEKGNYFWCLTRASLSSDMPVFYQYVEEISNIFLNRIGVRSDAVYQFLLIVHKDLSADIYINDFPVEIEAMSKRDIEKGEGVTYEDIADIRRLKFSSIETIEKDKVIFCFKVGWKFGLFFDLDRQQKLDIDKMWLDLGKLYRYLSFQYVYDALKTQEQFEEMIQNGWFPFVEIIGRDYKTLCKAYQNKFNITDTVEGIIESFNKVRLEKITNRWWRKQVFQDKRLILEAGVNAFLEGNSAGWIKCIKTLISEIEGIIRLQYFKDAAKGNAKLKELLTYLIEKGKGKAGSDDSLLMPLVFLDYLNDIVFADFNLETGQLDLSRHSSSHGVAKPEDYTKTKALQTILTLDQIYFYI